MNTELRFLVTIILMVGVLVVTNLLFPPASPVGSGADADTTAVSAPVATAPAPAASPPSEGAPAELADGTAASDSMAGPERTVTVEGPLYRHRFSTRGARLISAELTGFLSLQGDGPVRLLPEGEGALGLWLVAGSDTLDLRDASFSVDRDRVEVGDGPERVTFRHEAPGRTVEVTYVFRPDAYLIDVVGRVEGLDRALLVIDLGTGIPFNEANGSAEERSMAYVVNHLQDGIDSEGMNEVERPQVQEGPFVWAAFRSKFFVFALLPGAEGVGPEYFGGVLARPDTSEFRTGIAVTEPVGRDGAFAYQLFAGPQELGRLTALGSDLEEVNPYGWRFMRPIIRPLVGIITGVLMFLHGTFNLAYGWVLVIFGILMRLVLWPFNQKAMRAQMRNMAVQPLIKEIQAKHKDNPEKLQKEMMRLYKEYGFNPMAGCLPMLLPWPVLISLFFVFQNTIELRGVPFLWLPDLSAPDPLFILPAFLGLSMFFLQWISMRSMPESNPQMKMMMWMMPMFMVFIFFKLAAGLNLYYATANIATIPQQYWIAKERQKAAARGPVKLNA